MKHIASLIAFSLLTPACGGTGDGPGADGPHPIPTSEELKADNYISTNAREFLLTGVAHAPLPEGFDALDGDARTAALDDAIKNGLSWVSRAVSGHVEAVVKDANNGVTGEDAAFFSYFRSGASTLEQMLDVADGQVGFSFEVELVGSPYLMGKVAPDDGGGGARTFEVTVKKSWTDDTGEQVTVTMAGSPSRDAFPRYDELFADGVYDIAVHFGGDYNTDRLDLETCKWLVQHLVDEDWDNADVATFEDLKIDSPPWRRKLTVEGREVEARVYVYHSDMVAEADEAKLADALNVSLAERDVVIYSGHAGSNAGFILDYQPKFEVEPETFAALPMADKYQIYVLDGCMTYRTYVDALLTNPHKTFANLDVVTTVNTTPFAVGYQVLWEFLYWLTLTDDHGAHFPVSWQGVLRGVNVEAYASVHYGVHGIDDDPQLNPHASEGIACRPCGSDADCGAGGNYCLGYASGAGCGVACTTDTACPDGYRCGRVTEDPDLFYVPKQCMRRDDVCP